MTDGSVPYPPPQTRGERLARRLFLSALGVCAVMGGWQFLLMLEAETNHCHLTPLGYFDQVVVSKERTLFSVKCVLDPNNGEPRYTVHRPWQSVRGL